MGLFLLMKKYIIQEDLLTKVKALLKVGKSKNVVIEYNELSGIIKQLQNLPEHNTRKKKTYFFDVYFTGVHPVTDVLHEKNVLIQSKEFLSEDQIEQMIWKKFKFVRISANYNEIYSDEFQQLKEEFPVIKE